MKVLNKGNPLRSQHLKGSNQKKRLWVLLIFLGEAIDNFNSYLWGENDPEKLISTENMFF
jgi:hypothetical protein